MNDVQHNRHQHNRGAAALAVAAQHPINAYTLEVRTAGAALVAGLQQCQYRGWTASLNEHGELKFEYPYNATTWALFAFPRQIWLRRDDGTLLEKFHVIRRERIHDLTGVLVIHVTAWSLLYQLSREMVTNYETGNEQQTITVTATGGTFTLTFRGQTTGALAYNASAGTIQTALEGLSTIGAGNAAVTGAGPWVVTYQTTLEFQNVPLLTGNGSSLTGNRRVQVTTTRPTQTVTQVIAYLLANWQTNTLPINFGAVDAIIGDDVTTISVQNQSILWALNELRGRYGGYMYVDPANRRFYWRRRIGSTTGQYVRIGGPNGQNIQEEEDYSTLATRIIAIGAGETQEAQTTVTVNDATAQSAYGIIPHIIVNKNISGTAELTDWATAVLNVMKVPRKNYSVGVIDLARLTSADYRFHELTVGSHIRVIDTTLDLAIDTIIGSIERNLDNPLDIKITVTNPDMGSGVPGGGAGGDATNEAGVIPGGGRERDIMDTIADMLQTLLQEQRPNTDSIAQMIEEMISQILTEMTTTSVIYQTMQGASSATGIQPGTNIQATGAANTAGTGDPYAREDHVHSAVQSGTDIQDVGTANAAGSAATYAKSDHVHAAVQPETIDENILNIDDTNDAGVSTKYARADHVHRGYEIALDFASLEAMENGFMGITTGTTKRGYMRVNDTWMCVTHFTT